MATTVTSPSRNALTVLFLRELRRTSISKSTSSSFTIHTLAGLWIIWAFIHIFRRGSLLGSVSCHSQSRHFEQNENNTGVVHAGATTARNAPAVARCHNGPGQ